MIKFEIENKLYKNEKVLHKISFTIEKGDFSFLQGDSGSGKTTLLKILYGEITDYEGDVFIDNTRISELKKHELRRKMGVIFQSFELLDKKTALENVMLAGQVVGADRNTIKTKALELLNRVGLKGYENKFPSELSGGQQQRVAIARALLNEPKIIVADEPTGNLDPKNAENVMQLLYDINQKENVTMFIVTHSDELVRKFESKKFWMSKGSVIQQ